MPKYLQICVMIDISHRQHDSEQNIALWMWLVGTLLTRFHVPLRSKQGLHVNVFFETMFVYLYTYVSSSSTIFHPLFIHQFNPIRWRSLFQSCTRRMIRLIRFYQVIINQTLPSSEHIINSLLFEIPSSGIPFHCKFDSAIFRSFNCLSFHQVHHLMTIIMLS